MSNEPLSGQSVLIVEDEMMIAVMLEDMLEEIGCTVAGVAAKPAQALDILGTGKAIDAAILDLNLSGHNSYEIAAALDARGIPYLFSTGYTAPTVEARYRDRPFLQKPFRQEDLQKVLGAMLSK